MTMPSPSADLPKHRGLKWTDYIFAALMLALAGTCVFLGGWQMDRLGEKEALIAAVDQRLGAEPVPAPSVAQWGTLEPDVWNFTPVSLIGTFRYTQTITVFTSLTNPRGPYQGPGYWVVTPFELVGGGTVFVNRGYVPQDFQEQAALGDLHGDDAETITIVGLWREDEHLGWMTPDPNTSDRVEWVRNIARMGAMVDPDLAPLAPFYVDMLAGEPGVLPQAGETKVTFTNNHLGYSMTWYGFAIIAVLMLGYWLWRQARREV
jgi:surfeit locus 1 family protein